MMYAAVRHPIVTSTDITSQRILEDFLPNTLQKLPGFVAFYLIKLSAEEFYTVSIFETREQAEDSNRRALEWIQQKTADLIVRGPDPKVGELTISWTERPEEFPGEMAA